MRKTVYAYLCCFWFEDEGVEGGASDQKQETENRGAGKAAQATVEESENRFAGHHEFKEVREHFRLHGAELLPGDSPGQDAAGDEGHPDGGSERHGVREEVQETQYSVDSLTLGNLSCTHSQAKSIDR